MAPQRGDKEWYSIAEQVAKETNPEKLTILIAQLCNALDARSYLAHCVPSNLPTTLMHD